MAKEKPTTLADINVTLQNQNKTLMDQAKDTKAMNSNLSFFVKDIQARNRRDQEDKAEKKDKLVRNDVKGNNPNPQKSGGGMFSGMFGLLGDIGGVFSKIPVLAPLISSLLNFGKMFLRGGVIGLFLYMIYDNFDVIKKIFENVGNLLSKLMDSETVQWIKNKLGDIDYGKLVEDYFGSIRKGFQAIERLTVGDWEGFFDNISGVGTLIGTLLLLTKKGRALLGTAVTGAAKMLGVGISKTGEVVSDAAKGAAGALKGKGATTAAESVAKPVAETATKARNFKVVDGKYISVKTGKELTGAALSTAKEFHAADMAKKGGKGVGVTLAEVGKKFPKFAKFAEFAKRIPGIGTLITGGLLLSTLMSDAPISEKIAGVAGIFGGLGGAALGSIVGTAIFPGIGSAIGAGVGALLGDTLATDVAKFLLGEPTSLEKMFKNPPQEASGNMEGADPEALPSKDEKPMKFNAPTGSTVSDEENKRRMQNYKPRTYAPQTGESVKVLNAQSDAAKRAPTAIVVSDNSNKVNNTSINNSSQGIVMPHTASYDRNDPFFSTRGVY